MSNSKYTLYIDGEILSLNGGKMAYLSEKELQKATAMIRKSDSPNIEEVTIVDVKKDEENEA